MPASDEPREVISGATGQPVRRELDDAAIRALAERIDTDPVVPQYYQGFHHRAPEPDRRARDLHHGAEEIGGYRVALRSAAMSPPDPDWPTRTAPAPGEPDRRIHARDDHTGHCRCGGHNCPLDENHP